MKRLIVNADDYGLCPSVSEGILSAYACGAITDFSFMVDSRTFAEASASLGRSGIRACGIHLNLTSGRSLDGDRPLPGLKPMMRDLALGRLSAADVLREIDRQMDAVIRSGLEISHVDSHQNVHLLPFIFHHVRDRIEAEGRNVPIRIPSERIVSPFSIPAAGLFRLGALNILSLIPKRIRPPAVRVVGQKFFNNAEREAVLGEIAGTILSSGAELFEFPLHPGFCDCAGESECGDSYTRMRADELSFIIRRKDYFREKGIEEVSFAGALL